MKNAPVVAPFVKQLAPIREAPNLLGVSVSTVKRLAASFDDFPKLIHLSNRVTLFDIQASADWLRGHAGKPPMSVRGYAGKREVAA